MHMGEHEPREEMIDITVPGMPGWRPPEKPAFYNDPEAFRKEWERIRANGPSEEDCLKELQRLFPPAGPKTLNGPIR